MKPLILLLLAVCVCLPGCQAIKPEYSLFKSDSEERVDKLWRQGYGYNNPNPDRIRNGQDPVNFDGKPNNLKSATGDIAGRAIGNVIAFGIFEGIPAVFRGIRNKLQR